MRLPVLLSMHATTRALITKGASSTYYAGIEPRSECER